jgi:integrase
LAIYQRGTIWWIDYYFKGERLREPVSSSRKEAMEALESRRGDIVQGRFELVRKDRRQSTFEEFACEYLKHLKATRRWWKGEVSRMKSLVRHFGKMPLSEISTYDVEKYKEKRRKKLSGSGMNREFALLKSMLNRASEWGFAKIALNPVSKVGYFPERQVERILTNDEARRLIDASNASLRPVVVTALNTGMRRGEILDMRWTNVDFDRRFIRVERSKNNRSRKVPINSTLTAELSRLHASGTPFVFMQRAGERLKSIATAFATACRHSGLGHVRFHDLRHTFATNLVMNGVDLVTVKEILGHSDISMTVRYSHPSDERKMAAVEVIVDRAEERPSPHVSRGDGHNLVTVPDLEEKGQYVSH